MTDILTSIHGSKVGLDKDGNLILQGKAFTMTMTPAAGTTNVCEVTCRVVDSDGKTVAAVASFDLWLSDATTGAGLTATTASGTVDVKASSGAVLGVLTTKKAFRAQTKADGTFVLSITDSAKTLFKVAALVAGRTVVGATLITANYG